VANSVPFRLNRNGVMLALISAAFATEVGAAAGRVDFATTGATISGPDGRQRPLARGTELDKGDTIRTGDNARAQIRFADGAYVSLQPNTEFAIKDYNFDGKTDGSERGFFALARGAMRTVTGLIGRVNKNRYQISTPTATIGIRGTGGLISVLNDGSTLVNGTSGIWTLTNPSGTIDVPAGITGKAPAAPNQPPTQTTEKPSSGPIQPPTTQPPYAQADNRNDTGGSTVLPSNVLKSGTGYAGGAAFGIAPSALLFGGTGATATFDAQGRLTDVLVGTNQLTLAPGGSHAEFGTDGILAWGRWIGQVNLVCTGCSPQNYGPNDGLHWVAGLPTPVLPTDNSTATYNIIGATSPTYVGGARAPGSVTGGTFTVTFTPSAASFTLAGLGISMPDGTRLSLDGSGRATSAAFSFNPTVTVVSGVSGGACFACGCSSNMNAFFAGASAERIGASYRINDNGGGTNIVGAAAFSK
jgi:hypothetical protein